MKENNTKAASDATKLIKGILYAGIQEGAPYGDNRKYSWQEINNLIEDEEFFNQIALELKPIIADTLKDLIKNYL